MRPRAVIVAFLVAPLVAPVVVWTLLMVEGILAARANAAGAFMGLALYVAMGAPLAYVATTVVGIPGWLAARRWDVVSRIGAVATGAATGAIVAWLVAPELKGELVSIPLGPWRGAAAGAAVGFVWFVLASRRDR